MMWVASNEFKTTEQQTARMNPESRDKRNGVCSCCNDRAVKTRTRTRQTIKSGHGEIDHTPRTATALPTDKPRHAVLCATPRVPFRLLPTPVLSLSPRETIRCPSAIERPDRRGDITRTACLARYKYFEDEPMQIGTRCPFDGNDQWRYLTRPILQEYPITCAEETVAVPSTPAGRRKGGSCDDGRQSSARNLFHLHEGLRAWGRRC